MKSQNYTMVKLEPDEGNWLTESADVNIERRSFNIVVYTSSVNAGDWKEITDTEYKKLKAEQDEKIAEKLAKMEEK